MKENKINLELNRHELHYLYLLSFSNQYQGPVDTKNIDEKKLIDKIVKSSNILFKLDKLEGKKNP